MDEKQQNSGPADRTESVMTKDTKTVVEEYRSNRDRTQKVEIRRFAS